jgi:hypothetical protein
MGGFGRNEGRRWWGQQSTRRQAIIGDLRRLSEQAATAASRLDLYREGVEAHARQVQSMKERGMAPADWCDTELARVATELERIAAAREKVALLPEPIAEAIRTLVAGQ